MMSKQHDSYRPDHVAFHRDSTLRIFLRRSSRTGAVRQSFPVPSLSYGTAPVTPGQSASQWPMHIPELLRNFSPGTADWKQTEQDKQCYTEQSWTLSILMATFPGEPALACFNEAKDDGSGGDKARWTKLQYICSTLPQDVVKIGWCVTEFSLPLYRPFSRWSWVSWYQNVSFLDFIGAKGDGGK